MDIDTALDLVEDFKARAVLCTQLADTILRVHPGSTADAARIYAKASVWYHAAELLLNAAQ